MKHASNQVTACKDVEQLFEVLEGRPLPTQVFMEKSLLHYVNQEVIEEADLKLIAQLGLYL